MNQVSVLSKASLLILIVISLISAVSATDAVINLQGNFSSGTEHTLTFSNQSNIDDSRLIITNPEEIVEEIEMNPSEGSLEAVLPKELTSEKGVYKYYFKQDGERVPESGYFAFNIGSGNETLFQEFENLANNRPSDDPHCSEEGDFACELEHYQASMMLKHAKAYDLTEDQKHLDKSLNFSLNPYGSDEHREIACRHETNSFDCFSGADDPSGPVRQGALIQSLWTVYSKTGNTEVKELGTNYTEAEFGNDSCDVWNNNYDCGTGEETSYLANGFWKAYQTTGKKDYKSIAENLTVTTKPHPRMVEAHARALMATENTSYKQPMTKMFDEEFRNCKYSDCSTIEQLQLSMAGFKAHKATREQSFYSAAFQSRPKPCEDGKCDNPKTQGSSSTASLEAYASFKDESPRFFNPRILEHPSQNESLKTSIDFNGIINNSKAFLYDTEGNEVNSCNLSAGASECGFDHEWQDQQPYYIAFSSDELNYPDGDGIPIAYTQVDTELLNDANQLSYNLPDSQCNPFEDDYSCVSLDFNPYELDQASYIDGFSTAYDYSSNQTYYEFAESLSTPPYHYNQNPDEEDEDLCIPDNQLDGEEYRCDSFDDVFAGERQGSLISSLFHTYSFTENKSILYEAENYATSSVAEGSNDCDVWEDDFECLEDSKSQSAMIDGYWTAYRTTGNSTYRELAKNLTEESFNHQESYSLASSLWKAYSLSGKEIYSSNAENMTQELIENESCEDGCNLEEYIRRGEMFLNAYKASGNQTYIGEEGLKQHLNDRTEYSCLSEGQCDSPYLQGNAMSLITESAHTIPVSVGLEREITVSDSQITVGDDLETQCYAENVLEDTTVSELRLNVTSGPELGNKNFSYNIGDLEYTESNTTSNTFTAAEAGESEVTCDYTAAEINRTSTQLIEIEPEEDDSSSGGSSSSSSGSAPVREPSSQEEEKVEPIVYDFDYTEYNHSQVGLDDSYKYYNIYSDDCIQSSRIFERNKTILTTNQSCNSEANLVVEDNVNNSVQQKVFYDVGSEEKNISHPFKSNKSDWSKPRIAIFYERELEIESDLSENVETENDYHTIDFNLSRPEKCTVSQNQSIIFEGNSSSYNHNLSLQDGINHIEVECGTVSESFSIHYEGEDPDKSMQSIWNYILPLSIFTLVLPGAIGLYYRRKLISLGKIKAFDFYFDKIMNAVEDGNTETAIKNYEKLNKYCNFPEMGSDLEMKEGLKLYMMIDLVSDAGMEMGDAELIGDVKTSIGRFLTENPDSPLARHIKSKIKEM